MSCMAVGIHAVWRDTISAVYIVRLVHTYTNSLETLSLRPLSLEDTFPMGGYFNEFRREGVSAALVLELRVAVRAAIIQSPCCAAQQGPDAIEH